MAKKITAVVKLQLPAGKATPGPPVGSSLGPHGINIPAFTKEFNEKTSKQAGLIIPVVITIYQDRSFTFILKTPPAPVLIKKACGIESASARPNRDKVAPITKGRTDGSSKLPSVKIRMIPRPTYAPAMAELTQKPSGLFADRRAMRAALAAHLLIVSVNI